MPFEAMIEKAYDLLQKGRVEKIGHDLYNVIGNHGTYIVASRMDGLLSCSCLGFSRRSRCSHSLAVLMLIKPFLKRTVAKELEKDS